MRVERTPSLLTLGVVSSTDGLRIDTIAVGALDNYFVCSTNFVGPQTTNGLYITSAHPSVCYPTYSFDRTSRKPNRRLLVSAQWKSYAVIFGGVVAATWRHGGRRA